MASADNEEKFLTPRSHGGAYIACNCALSEENGRGRKNLHRHAFASPDHVAALQAGGMVGAGEMNVLNWIGCALALLLGVYLVVALLLPEKFE
jgi:K+-transporting ATPase KdpF subunit